MVRLQILLREKGVPPRVLVFGDLKEHLVYFCWQGYPSKKGRRYYCRNANCVTLILDMPRSWRGCSELFYSQFLVRRSIFLQLKESLAFSFDCVRKWPLIFNRGQLLAKFHEFHLVHYDFVYLGLQGYVPLVLATFRKSIRGQFVPQLL